MPFLGGSEARTRYRSREYDLSRLAMRLAGRVQIFLRDGRILVDECRIPPGFAGDTDREQRMRDKFRREGGAVLGPRADIVLAWFESAEGERLARAFAPLRLAHDDERQ